MIEIDCTGHFDFCRRLSAAETNNAPMSNPYLTVSSILMVGALVENDGRNLEHADALFLQEIISGMLAIGMKFGSQKVSICNLEYGHDFFETTPHVDLLMLCYINQAAMWPKRGWSFGGPESPLLRQGETWKSALEKSGSSFIAVNGIGATSIERHDIPEGYTELELNDLDYTTKIFANNRMPTPH